MKNTSNTRRSTLARLRLTAATFAEANGPVRFEIGLGEGSVSIEAAAIELGNAGSVTIIGANKRFEVLLIENLAV